MTDTRITDALLEMLDTKLTNKRSEMDSLSQPVVTPSPEHIYRKFQVEVEYWQLHEMIAELRSLVKSLSAPA